MSGNFPVPPTFADPVLVDEATRKAKFNPIWLRWFLDLAQLLTAAGGGGIIGFDHNALADLQGGSAPNEFYHLTGTEHTELVNAKAAHTVYAGPSSGGSAVPAFRLLVTGDLPTGTGTVTSVDASFATGLITVSGGPITSTGTLAFTVAGTSGGIPYFSGAATWASSSALTQHALVLGGGAGNPPSTPVGLGTTTTLLHGNAAGDPTWAAVDLANEVTGILSTAHFPGITVTITTAALTIAGTQGSMTFTNGVLTAQTPAT